MSNNNCNFNPANINRQFLLEKKDDQPALDNGIHIENILNRKENCLKEFKYNNLKKVILPDTKSKKIFNITHIKRKASINLDTENQICLKKVKLFEVKKTKKIGIDKNTLFE